MSLPPPTSPSSGRFDRCVSESDASQQLAHQLAAETLLTMAPSASKSPGTRTDGVSVPALAPTGRTTPMDVDSSEESRGVKRKNGEDEPKLPCAATLDLVGLDEEREAAKERAYSHSPLAAHEMRPSSALAAAKAHTSPFIARHTQEAAARTQNSLAGRHPVYGPTDRHLASVSPLPGSPWGGLSQRYNPLGIRRDIPSTLPGAASKIGIDGIRRPSPDSHRDPRFYPNAATSSTSTSLSGYGHYSMGRRELAEHREQLREGKRWLETMLAKTGKMLHMVENKMALTGEMGSTATTTMAAAGTAVRTGSPAGAATANGLRKPDEWDFEERERNRQKEIKRLEEERERDRAERDKWERERDKWEHERDHASQDKERSLSGLGSRERSEAERNRDLLLASRRVSAVSPNGRERSTTTSPSSTAQGASSAIGTGLGSKPGAWDGDPVMSGVALPRREQGTMHRNLGRGLWSFDIRG